MEYLVWDDFGESRETARKITADDPEEAVIEYAETDCDGQIDGIYLASREPMRNVEETGWELIVEDPDGKRHNFLVGITEYTPVFSAVKVKEE